MLTSGNIADNNGGVLAEVLEGLQGQCIGDRGYLTRLFATFYLQGWQLIIKIKRKMKNVLMPLSNKLKLRMRELIESVNDLLTSVLDVSPTRHRSAINAQVDMLSGLIAYCFYPTKPFITVAATKRLYL